MRRALMALGALALVTGCDLPERASAREERQPLPPPPPKEEPPVPVWAIDHGVELFFLDPGSDAPDDDVFVKKNAGYLFAEKVAALPSGRVKHHAPPPGMPKPKGAFEKASCKLTLVKRPKKGVSLKLGCTDLPRQMTVSYDGKTFERTEGQHKSKYSSYEIEGAFVQMLGPQRLEALQAENNIKLSLPIELEMTFERTEPVTVKVPAVWTSIDVFEALFDDEKVRISDDEPADDGEKSALLLAHGNSIALIGQGTTFNDVDYLVRGEEVDTGKERECEIATLHIYDAKMTMTDRRTGKAVASTTLKNSHQTCPKEIVVDRNNPNYDRKSLVTRKDMQRWVAGQLRTLE